MRLISTPPNLILGTWTALAVGAACCAPNGAPALVRPAARAAPLCKNPRRVFDMEATSRNNQFNRSLSTYTPHALLCCLNHGGLMCKLSCLLILTAAALAAAELPPYCSGRERRRERRQPSAPKWTPPSPPMA